MLTDSTDTKRTNPSFKWGAMIVFENDDFVAINKPAELLSIPDRMQSEVSLKDMLIGDINETQNCSVEFPIIADDDRKVSELYDFIHPNASATATVRSLVIIGPDKAVKLMITYPASTGRNFVEVLRVIDSLQLTANYSVATPANWAAGQKVIVVPAISTEDAIKKFPKGVEIVKPYLRYTPQPDID